MSARRHGFSFCCSRVRDNVYTNKVQTEIKPRPNAHKTQICYDFELFFVLIYPWHYHFLLYLKKPFIYGQNH